MSNPICEGIGNPDDGGLFVPTLPPFEEDGESVDEFVFGEFEFVGEMDVAASCHMIAFCTVFFEVVQIQELHFHCTDQGEVPPDLRSL